MSKIRCLVCGSSQFDSKGYKCGRCGAAMGLREERCYVTEETRKMLLDHAEELAAFGIKLEEREPLQKSADTVLTVAGLIVACADSFRDGVLGDLVCYLRDRLRLPEDEILKLRLDEPEKIVAYFASKSVEESKKHLGKGA